ncbi:hypothetical protein [Kytococcus sedentarius]|uniref:hypothetical protein n=1 Tax=Kytococcus sedentarius TaxID=1276 RepID=UPI0035BC4C54
MMRIFLHAAAGRRVLALAVAAALGLSACGENTVDSSADPAAAPSSSAPSSSSPQVIEAATKSYPNLTAALADGEGAVRGTVVRSVRTTDELEGPGPHADPLRYELLELKVEQTPGLTDPPSTLIVAQVASDDAQQTSGFGPHLEPGDRGVFVLRTPMTSEDEQPEFGWVYVPVAVFRDKGDSALVDEEGGSTVRKGQVDKILREANQDARFHASTKLS